MAITLERGKISECLGAVNKIVDASDDARNNIPFEISYWALRLSKKLKVEDKKFIEDRDDFLITFGEKVLDPKTKIHNGKYRLATPESAEKYQEAVKKLSEETVTLDNVDTKNFSQFGEEIKGIYSAVKFLVGDFIILEEEKTPTVKKDKKTEKESEQKN